jgi:hypothetical protein
MPTPLLAILAQRAFTARRAQEARTRRRRPAPPDRRT